MADRIIDYDRGVLINTHFSGMDVFMYVDDPGKFLTAHNTVVPDEIAKQAGYDTDKLGKERVRLERRKVANALIDKEMADDKDIVETVVFENNGFKLVSIGMGRHNVRDPDGNILNAHPLPKETGEKLFAAMAGTPDKSIKQDGAKK